MKKKKHEIKRRKIHRRATRHTPPGSLVVDPEAPPPTLRVMAFSPEAFEEQATATLETVAELRNQWPIIWVDIVGLGDTRILQQIGDLFKLHRLALEDAVNLYQRAKVDQYEDQLFIVNRMIRQRHPLETIQLSVFVGADMVVTMQEHEGTSLEPVRTRIRNRVGRIREAGIDFLAYTLIDTVLDDYFPALEEYGERLDSIEEAALSNPTPDVLVRLRLVKRDLMTLRRSLWPQREALYILARDPLPLIRNETRIYYRDCLDHAQRLMDMTEHYREQCTDLMEVYHSTLSQRTNEVMRTLTVIASIFIPLTFIVGIYGMNFDPEASPWNMPELAMRYGYPATMLGMLGLALAMLWLFKRKGWLGPSSSSG